MNWHNARQLAACIFVFIFTYVAVCIIERDGRFRARHGRREDRLLPAVKRDALSKAAFVTRSAVSQSILNDRPPFSLVCVIWTRRDPSRRTNDQVYVVRTQFFFFCCL